MAHMHGQDQYVSAGGGVPDPLWDLLDSVKPRPAPHVDASVVLSALCDQLENALQGGNVDGGVSVTALALQQNTT